VDGSVWERQYSAREFEIAAFQLGGGCIPPPQLTRIAASERCGHHIFNGPDTNNNGSEKATRRREVEDATSSFIGPPSNVHIRGGAHRDLTPFTFLVEFEVLLSDHEYQKSRDKWS
jgi:hypothetical protein